MVLIFPNATGGVISGEGALERIGSIGEEESISGALSGFSNSFYHISKAWIIFA